MLRCTALHRSVCCVHNDTRPVVSVNFFPVSSICVTGSPVESEAELREPSFTPENVHEYANETITRLRSSVGATPNDRRSSVSPTPDGSRSSVSATPNDSTSSAHLSPTHESNNCQQLERTQKILPLRYRGRRARFMDYCNNPGQVKKAYEDMKRQAPRRIPVQRYCNDVDGPKTAQSHEDLKCNKRMETEKKDRSH
eukprot:Lankesteria_metandrocarpae@DN5486_c0_g1_i1.p1